MKAKPVNKGTIMMPDGKILIGEGEPKTSPIYVKIGLIMDNGQRGIVNVNV